MKKEVDMEKFWNEAELRHTKLKEIAEQIARKTGVQIPVRELDRKKIEEDAEYVKAKTKEIEERILPATGDLFESPRQKEGLHVTIRIACEFHKFLLDFGDLPPRDEAEYVADTIRSGIDWFMSLASTCHYLDDELAAWSFDRQAVSNFHDLRSACMKHFEELRAPSASLGTMLACLLTLTHLELVFMAQTYPFFLHSYTKEDQWLTNRI